jgi:lysophospholipase L1-like esterase
MNTGATAGGGRLGRLGGRLFRAIDQLDDPAQIEIYRQANQVLVAAQDPRARIVFLGDSIPHLWPDLDGLAPAGAQIVNRGIPGQTSTQMLLRFQPDVAAIGASAVVILAGLNDIRADFGSPASVGPGAIARVSRNIAAMADMAEGRGMALALCALPPMPEPFKGMKASVARRDPAVLASLNAWLADFAASRNAVLIDFQSVLADASGRLNRGLTDDGLHPNGAGYRAMGEVFGPALERLITRRAARG